MCFLCAFPVLGLAQPQKSQAVSGCARISDPSAVIGTVISAEGKWCDHSCSACPLWKLYPVTLQSEIIPERISIEHLSIVIRSRSGSREVFDCSQPRELGCKKPIDLSRLVTTEKTTGILSAFWQAISELAADRPAVYDSFRQGILQSRGFRQRGLVDGVAELSTAGVKVDNILRDLPAGEYVLELCPLGDHGRPVCGNHLQRIHYKWEPTKPNPYPATSAAPGMYALYDYSENPGSANVSRNYAEVLVSEAAKYEFRSKQFSEVEQATRAWDLNDATAPALRRAYLYSLSRH